MKAEVPFLFISFS